MNINHKIYPSHFSKVRLNWLLIAAFWVTCSIGSYAQDDPAKAATAGADPAKIELGKTLFTQKCQSCHGLTDEVVVGPGLKGILERRNEAWLLPWIKNSQAVIASGDKYAVELYNKFNKTQMQSFDLSDDEIRAILVYVDTESKKLATASTATAKDGATGEKDAKTDSGSSSIYLTLILGVLLLVLVLMIAVLTLLLSVLTRYLNQRKEELNEADKELLEQKFNLGAIFQNRIFIGGVTLIFALVLAKAGIDSLVNIGVQQGYAPTQPIPFSHKLHAGEYQIECQYCHVGVNKGKTAVIPSANICMNCHNEIKRESPHIQKIYAALENDKPIEWVRVHNLPDFAYFNHSQHVKVGGLACESCHGEIKEMEVVQQKSTLTMGWCIDCHRQTVVQAEGNAYYDKLMAVHTKNGKYKPMKVENIGGLECAKCHY